MQPDLTSAYAKLQRARQYGDAINKEILDWMVSEPYRATPVVNADQTRYSVIHEVVTPPQLERWALMIGDFFHNARAALDHLMYSVAIEATGQNPPPHHRRWYFPIAKSKTEYWEKVDRIDKPRLIRNSVWAAIEQSQPYNRTSRVGFPILLMLEEFDNADKHRLLNWADETQVRGELTNIRREDCGGLPLVEVYCARTPKHGGEIAALVFAASTPGVHYHFESYVTLDLEYLDGGNRQRIDYGLAIEVTLEELREVVEQVLARLDRLG